MSHYISFAYFHVFFLPKSEERMHFFFMLFILKWHAVLQSNTVL